jgi:multiple sugar transport system substrate-binding protein
MGKEEKIDRRKYIKYVGAGAAVAAAAAIGYGISELTKPPPPKPTTVVTTVPTTITIPTTVVTPTTTPMPTFDWRQCKGESIKVLGVPHAYTLGLEPSIPEFERLTGIKVTYDLLTEMEWRRKMAIDLSTGAGEYDVHAVGLSSIPPYAKPRWLEPLDPYLEDPTLTPPEYDKEDIPKRLWDQVRDPIHVDHPILAVPAGYSNVCYYYRKDIWEKYGLNPNPKTLEERHEQHVELQKALRREGITDQYAYVTRGARGAGMVDWTFALYLANYAEEQGKHRFPYLWFDEDWNPVFNDTQGVEALEKYVEHLGPDVAPPGPAGYDLYKVVESFITGKVMAAQTGTDHQPTLNNPERSVIVGKWEATWVPVKRLELCSTWIWGFGINWASKHKKAAWLFILWATSKELMSKIGTRICPTRLSAWEIPEYKQPIPPIPPNWVKHTKWAMANAEWICPFIPEFFEVDDYISIAVSDAIAGARKPKEALDWAAEKVREVLKREGYYM